MFKNVLMFSHTCHVNCELSNLVLYLLIIMTVSLLCCQISCFFFIIALFYKYFWCNCCQDKFEVFSRIDKICLYYLVCLLIKYFLDVYVQCYCTCTYVANLNLVMQHHSCYRHHHSQQQAISFKIMIVPYVSYISVNQ